MRLVLRTSSVAADMREKKDSGVEWIGVIPNHWHIKKVKYLFEIVKRIAGSEGFDILSVTQKGLKIKDISSGEGQIAENYSNYQFVYPNDFVMNHMDLLTGWIDVSQLFGVTSPDYRVFRLMDRESHNIGFFKYVMQNCYLNRIFYSLGQGVSSMGRWRLQTIVFNNFDIPIPPLKEQQSIADFLDTKCAELDALMEDIRAEISTLEEYKKSVITEAVTKGLNPDAEMKDSGIAWVGKCPEHWKILKIRDSISKIESGVSVNAASNPAGDNEIGVLKTSCVSKYIFDARENKAVNKNEESRVSCPVRKGCIIVSRMNTPDLVGACGYVAEEANGIYLPDRLWQVHVKTTYSAQYVTYYLMSHIARSYYASIAVGTSSTMQNISQKEFGCMFFCVPEIEEQQAIADYLDAKCDEIAATIAEKQKQLTTLEEYKKSLIYEYVTGKKEVPTL